MDPLKESASPMVGLGTSKFKLLNIGKIKSERQFTTAYAEEIRESEKVCTPAKLFHDILDAKHENSYLRKVMKNQCQHLTQIQSNKLLKLLK